MSSKPECPRCYGTGCVTSAAGPIISKCYLCFPPADPRDEVIQRQRRVLDLLDEPALVKLFARGARVYYPGDAKTGPNTTAATIARLRDALRELREVERGR